MKKAGLTGSTLKYIAVITMFLDHIGASLIENALPEYGTFLLSRQVSFLFHTNLYTLLQILDWALRFIGRVSFPLFCFLLVEGFFHTGNVFRYGFRLFLFALISEIPFDLAFRHKFLDFRTQNVFFTLTIAIITMAMTEWVKKTEAEGKLGVFTKIPYFPKVCILILGCGAAFLLKTDYDVFGVLMIMLLYYDYPLHKVRGMTLGCAALCMMSSMEITSFFAIIPVKRYNGQRGLSMKYFFYLFYPLHLLFLYGIYQLLF